MSASIERLKRTEGGFAEPTTVTPQRSRPAPITHGEDTRTISGAAPKPHRPAVPPHFPETRNKVLTFPRQDHSSRRRMVHAPQVTRDACGALDVQAVTVAVTMRLRIARTTTVNTGQQPRNHAENPLPEPAHRTTQRVRGSSP
jgi:hypothetical protein